MNKKSIEDITRECAALLKQEHTLAYFDFQLQAGRTPLEGLCRIGHPRRDPSGKDFISLVFVVDTPEEASRTPAMAALRPLGGGMLESALPELFSAIPVPPAPCSPQIYIRQFDLILKDRFRASQEFIARRLYPALTAGLNLTVGELGWWDQEKKQQAPEPVADEKPKPLIARLREKLFG